MKNDITKLQGRIGHAQLAAVGAASGPSNRSRTIRSSRDKARCPRRQRKSRSWQSE